VRAAQYANSSGAIANASGWKNSQVRYWYVGVEEEHGRERHREPAVVDAIAREQVHRNGAARLHEHLHGEQEERTRAQPVEGHEREQDGIDMVAEELEAPNGHEGVVEARQQPDALVVDAQVERQGSEARVALPAQDDEDGTPAEHHRSEHPGHGVVG